MSGNWQGWDRRKCVRKVAYRSERAARLVMAQMDEADADRRRVYACGDHWHIGRRPVQVDGRPQQLPKGGAVSVDAEQIRARHTPVQVDPDVFQEPRLRCRSCLRAWPCDADVLADEVERLRDEVERLTVIGHGDVSEIGKLQEDAEIAEEERDAARAERDALRARVDAVRALLPVLESEAGPWAADQVRAALDGGAATQEQAAAGLSGPLTGAEASDAPSDGRNGRNDLRAAP